MRITLIATRALSYYGRKAKGEEFTAPERDARVLIGLRHARAKTETEPAALSRPVEMATATAASRTGDAAAAAGAPAAAGDIDEHGMTAETPTAVGAMTTRPRRRYRRRDIKPTETK
jgi:hypothetical protein